MNFVNAELSKLAVNTFVTTKITYANMLAHICERLPGGDVDKVTAAIGHDTRIGVKYLKGAVGYGGPCFPRDNLAMSALARGLEVQAALAETTDRQNRAEVDRLADLIQQTCQAGCEGRHPRPLLQTGYGSDRRIAGGASGQAAAGRRTATCWSTIRWRWNSARVVLGDAPQYCGSAEECVRQSDLVVITVPWKEFLEIPESAFAATADRADRRLADGAGRVARQNAVHPGRGERTRAEGIIAPQR